MSTVSRSFERLKKALPKNGDVALRNEVTRRLFEGAIQISPRKSKLIDQWLNLTPSRPKGGRPVVVTPEIATKLHAFFCQNDISCTRGDRQYQVYMRKDKDTNNPIYIPKKFLLWTLADLVDLIKASSDDDLSSLKFSSIYRFLRKNNKEFVLQNLIPHESCLCKYCANIDLLCAGVNKTLSEQFQLPTSCHDILEKFACSKTLLNDNCAENICSNCPDLSDLNHLQNYEEFTFQQWTKKGSYYEKIMITKSSKETIADLTSKIKLLKGHYYRKRKQSALYNQDVENIEEDEAVVHVDFSENYKNRQQGEIKSAYFGQQSFSLYTVCGYISRMVCERAKVLLS